MENQIYRVNMENGVDLEFYVCGTNEVEPYREIREMGVQLVIGEKQLDASLDIKELESFIKYLTECKEYISEYNKSK